MFGKVHTRTLAIIIAIAIIAIIVIRSCYVCEGFVQGYFTREEAQKYFIPGSEQDSEKAYLANKIYSGNGRLYQNLEKNLTKRMTMDNLKLIGMQLIICILMFLINLIQMHLKRDWFRLQKNTVLQSKT